MPFLISSYFVFTFSYVKNKNVIICNYKIVSCEMEGRKTLFVFVRRVVWSKHLWDETGAREKKQQEKARRTMNPHS